MDTYLDKSKPIEQRVEDLLGRMTLREKVGQLNQALRGWKAYSRQEDGYTLTEAFREQVRLFDGMGAMYGLFRADPWTRVTFENGIQPQDSYRVSNLIQRYVLENTRLGIPVLLSEECSHGHQSLGGTLFPTNIGAASTWNPELYEQAMSIAAREIRSKGAHLGLLAGLDIMHDPRWGRTEECYGEDPYLASEMTRAGVRGLQGDGAKDLNGERKVVAVLKHFAGQGAGIGGHNAAPVPIGERELREIHLPGMKAGVESGTLGCMAAYNEIDGVPCHANRRLLTDILRGEWGFEGIVMADGSGLNRLLAVAGDEESAAALALRAGVDLSLFDRVFPTLENAVHSGKAEERLLDEAVRRVLRLKFRLGLFDDRRFVDDNGPVYVSLRSAARQLNEQIAQESIVLLKNSGGLLPLDRSRLRRIAVLGPNADALYNQLGDYTSSQTQDSGVTLLQGIRSLVEPGTEVTYARGCGIRETNKEQIADAVRLACVADAVVVALGGCSTRDFAGAFDSSNGAALLSGPVTEMDCGENVDVADLELGGHQVELLREVMATGKPVVVVLIQGRPHAIPWLAEHCPAIMCAWYPGQEGGRAIAKTLFGESVPSGKLPLSIPRSSAQLPVYYNHKPMYNRYLDMLAKPQYPFGYGLSYTSFEYKKLELENTTLEVEQLISGQCFVCDVTLLNTGAYRGAEVVQLYVRDKVASVTRRIRELKGFRKVWLEPGETKTVRMKIGQEALGLWNADMNFVVEPGDFDILAGNGQETYLSAAVTVRG